MAPIGLLGPVPTFEEAQTQEGLWLGLEGFSSKGCHHVSPLPEPYSAHFLPSLWPKKSHHQQVHEKHQPASHMVLRCSTLWSWPSPSGYSSPTMFCEFVQQGLKQLFFWGGDDI